MAAPANIDDYISAFPADTQTVLQAMRATIATAIPDGRERISYSIPAFEVDGKVAVFFAGWKHHVSMYPLPTGDADLDAAMEPYRESKGTLRFPLAAPIPYALIGRVAAAHAAARRR